MAIRKKDVRSLGTGASGSPASSNPGPRRARPADGRARIGVSGWVYPHWTGAFFPEGVTLARRLAYVGRHFSSVEINGTFYSLKRPEVFERWRSEVPPGFVFAVKASRYYTHM